jgi:hypothetical protein
MSKKQREREEKDTYPKKACHMLTRHVKKTTQVKR